MSKMSFSSNQFENKTWNLSFRSLVVTISGFGVLDFVPHLKEWPKYYLQVWIKFEVKKGKISAKIEVVSEFGHFIQNCQQTFPIINFLREILLQKVFGKQR